MVDALREVHRILIPGGLLIDARPDSRVLAFAERVQTRGLKRFGLVGTSKAEMENDRASDRAIARVVRDGLFRSKRRGRFWYRVLFDNLADLRRYLWEHLRLWRRARWIVDEATRRRHSTELFVIRRPVRYEILEATQRNAVGQL